MVHEQVGVVGLAVELVQFGAEVAAEVGHDLFVAGEDGVGERPTPVFGGEDQVDVEVVDDAAAPAYIRIRGSSW